MEDTSMSMYIPTIGDEVTLASDWKFGLYYEYRNEAMIKFIFPGTDFKWRDMVLPSGEKPEYGQKICEIVLPVGAILKVARIYIRNGAKEFDSVTFNLQSIPKKDIAIPDERDVWVANKELDPEKAKYDRANGGYVKKTYIKSKVRFWAKLKDVNKMKFYMGREVIKEEERPVVHRLIRFD